MSLPLTQIIFHQAILMGILKISRKIHSVLHLNIRGLNKNFESFAELYKSLSFNSALSAFQKRGLVMKISIKTHFFN